MAGRKTLVCTMNWFQVMCVIIILLGLTAGIMKFLLRNHGMPCQTCQAIEYKHAQREDLTDRKPEIVEPDDSDSESDLSDSDASDSD